MTLTQDIADYLAYIQGSPVPSETIALALQYKGTGVSGTGNSDAPSSYSIANYSGIIAESNTPQDLAIALRSREYITIQNLDENAILLIGIDQDAASGTSYEIEPRGSAVIERGEADKRISVLSAEAGLKFVAIARIRS